MSILTKLHTKNMNILYKDIQHNIQHTLHYYPLFFKYVICMLLCFYDNHFFEVDLAMCDLGG